MTRKSNFRLGMAISPALWMITVVVVATSPAMARDNDHKRHRGYVDGSVFAELADDDSTLIEVSINGPLLKMVAAALGEDNEGIGSLLSGIVSISAVVLEDSEDGEESAVAIAADIAADLKKDGWDQIVRVREHGESVMVMVLLDEKHDGSLAGITVMVSESGGETVFANIAGRIDLSIIGKLAAGFGIPGLENLHGLDLGGAVKKSKGKRKSKRHHDE